MCNIGFREFLKKLKIALHLTKVGDRYVIQKMKQTNVNWVENNQVILFSLIMDTVGMAFSQLCSLST